MAAMPARERASRIAGAWMNFSRVQCEGQVFGIAWKEIEWLFGVQASVSSENTFPDESRELYVLNDEEDSPSGGFQNRFAREKTIRILCLLDWRGQKDNLDFSNRVGYFNFLNPYFLD